ncbi:MAG: response regulator, partial [Pseudanabaenaceae cyanobacterium SKYGB_i_bin29]|nr:response regulator [Pseudanabaenaceae cyanobacterium SKYG29]MDW8421693.1 response regulator [Pseudanabaenaceae cyanobacterium SKYGB_i_bin29]
HTTDDLLTEEPAEAEVLAAVEETPEHTTDDLLTEEPAEAEVLAAVEETPEHTTDDLLTQEPAEAEVLAAVEETPETTIDDLLTEEPAEAEVLAAAEETPESTIDDLLTQEPAEAEVLAAVEETPEHTIDDLVTEELSEVEIFGVAAVGETPESTTDDLFAGQELAGEDVFEAVEEVVGEPIVTAPETAETPLDDLLAELGEEEDEPSVSGTESEIDNILAAIEEGETEEVSTVEQQIEAIGYSEEEDMTILQGAPEFFATVTAEPKIPEELMEEVSLEDLLPEAAAEESTPEEDVTTIQEMPEFFATVESQEEESGFNIRAYDQQTDVVEFTDLFSMPEESLKPTDIEEELSQLLGDMEEQEIEEIASTFSGDEEDESGFFFSQETITREDDEGEITLIQLFNTDNREEELPDAIDDLVQLLGGSSTAEGEDTGAEMVEKDELMEAQVTSDVFAELESLLGEEVDASQLQELEALLEEPAPVPSSFDDLDALLSSIPPSPSKAAEVASPVAAKAALNITPPPGPSPRSTMVQNMRVDVRYLDNMNNLVGELIVNRNLLQQDQQRLQASLANLFNQINKLNDVAQKVRDEFDRSLMERRLEETLGHRYLKEERRGLTLTPDSRHQEQEHSSIIANDLDKHDKFNELALDIIELITRVKESASDVEFVIDETEQVSRQLGTITAQIEDDLKQVRMEPFSEISDRLPKQVRDLALKRKKQADIEISGRETMIDKVILQGLNTPINHLITNALVHGIEDPETRIALGKPPKGKITVKAYHQGNETIISVSDDGAGINPEKVRQSAITKGILTRAEAALLSDQDTYSLLFRPGFSTKAEVDEEGGRGVGLDAVVTQLNSIKGSIHVESAIGKGTTFTIRLPLTLSISKAIVCICNRNRVAFPVDSFEDVVEITQDKVYKNAEGLPCFMWRDRELTFRPLQDLLFYNRQIGRLGFIKHSEDDIISIIVLRSERNFLALQVDKFEGEIEIVIKQIEGPAPKPPGIAGVTVLGDGRVMAICNVLELFAIAAGTIAIPKYEQVQTEVADKDKSTTVLVVDDSVTMRKALVQTFEKAGYRVEEARNGKEAWDKLTSGLSCDLIFSDVEMPQMNGFQLLEKLQKDEQLRRIPVAMLTSQGKRVHIENAAKMGAKAYFVKAYTDQEVLEGAKRLLRGQVAGKILEIMSS